MVAIHQRFDYVVSTSGLDTTVERPDELTGFIGTLFGSQLVVEVAFRLICRVRLEYRVSS